MEVRVDQMLLKKMTDELASEITNFLGEHGGHEDGYYTYACAVDVSHDVSQPIMWSTPGSINWTDEKMEEYGEKLNNLLVKVLNKHDFTGTVQIDNHKIGRKGRYKTVVSVRTESLVKLRQDYNWYKMLEEG